MTLRDELAAALATYREAADGLSADAEHDAAQALADVVSRALDEELIHP